MNTNEMPKPIDLRQMPDRSDVYFLASLPRDGTWEWLDEERGEWRAYVPEDTSRIVFARERLCELSGKLVAECTCERHSRWVNENHWTVTEYNGQKVLTHWKRDLHGFDLVLTGAVAGVDDCDEESAEYRQLVEAVEFLPPTAGEIVRGIETGGRLQRWHAWKEGGGWGAPHSYETLAFFRGSPPDQRQPGYRIVR